MGWNTSSGIGRVGDALESRWIWVYGDDFGEFGHCLL